MRFADIRHAVSFLTTALSPKPVAAALPTVAVACGTLLWASSTAHAQGDLMWEPIQPLRAIAGLDPALVKLGRDLFHDPRLSSDDTISCATCHDLDRGGIDHLPRSRGVAGATGELNAPTVFNAALNFKQFWDGRADSLEDQIDGPTHSQHEMNSNWAEILKKLGADSEMSARFAKFYEDGLNPANVKDAIATFERTLTTPNSRFDRYILGETTILDPQEIEGYRVFKRLGCSSCHQGSNAVSNMFQTLGIMDDYFEDRGNVKKSDYGRYNVTGIEADRHRFKVPSLRLAALTPPYNHDGSAATLEDAVRVMGQYQLGIELERKDIELIVLFLKTLPGEYDGKPLCPDSRCP